MIATRPAIVAPTFSVPGSGSELHVRRRRSVCQRPVRRARYGSSDVFTSWSTVTGFGTRPSVVMKSSDCCQPAVSIVP